MFYLAPTYVGAFLYQILGMKVVMRHIANSIITKKKKLIILLLIVVALLIFIWYENNHIVVTEYSVSNTKINEALLGYKIVQISDFHNATFGGRDNSVFLDKIESLNPNIIVITGDLVDSNHTNIDISLTMVSGLTKIAPVYYVTGNHEYWLSESDRQKLFDGLVVAGAVILNNEAKEISVGDLSFILVGLDDKHLYDDTLMDILDSHDELNIVLAHEPQYINYYSRNGADIVLTGHAHGGQFILPILGPVVAPDQGLWPALTEGMVCEGETTMVISRGLGNSVIPVRLFNDPEIVVVNID